MVNAAIMPEGKRFVKGNAREVVQKSPSHEHVQ